MRNTEPKPKPKRNHRAKHKNHVLVLSRERVAASACQSLCCVILSLTLTLPRTLAPTLALTMILTVALTTQPNINLHEVNDWLISPATAAEQCSFVEIISENGAPQPARYFISHWWGEPVLDFVAAVECHAQAREVHSSDGYWVCAYANNQHALDEEIVLDPKDFPQPCPYSRP